MYQYEQEGCRFTDDISKCLSLNENVEVLF